MRRVLLLAVAVVLAPVLAFAQDVVVDRVLATVDTRMVTLSDVRAVRALGLVVPPQGTDATTAILNALVDRVLVLEEVERYAPPDPETATVDRGVAAIRSAHASSYDAALSSAGLDESFVRHWVRNDLRIESYLSQRFAGVLEPSDDDIETYRRAHAAQAGAGQPLDDASVRTAVVAERRAALVREWIDGLRSRASVTLAPPL